MPLAKENCMRVKLRVRYGTAMQIKKGKKEIEMRYQQCTFRL